jgi:hypothetical protein
MICKELYLFKQVCEHVCNHFFHGTVFLLDFSATHGLTAKVVVQLYVLSYIMFSSLSSMISTAFSVAIPE